MNDKQLKPNALAEAEFSRRGYRAIVPGDTSIEDMVVPSYWAHVASRLRPGDMIEVLAEDNSFYAEFIVRSARRLDATVSLLRRVELEPAKLDASITEGYEIKFRGSRSKWSILRGKDVLRDGFETEAQARVYLDDHLKAMAA
jgi:hypothetical protein